MKITVEVSEKELAEICEITGIAKKGPAIRRLLAESLQIKRRAKIAGKFLSGQWSAELKDIEATKAVDRAQSETLATRWRD